MKAVIGEYGKVIILAVLLCSMVLFLFGKGDHGFLGILRTARPMENLGHEDAFETAKAIASRSAPGLSVRTVKLHEGDRYNLLDTEYFQIKAENEDGGKAELSVIKMVDPAGKDITHTTEADQFKPDQKGVYQITYRALDTYLESTKVSEKTYRFIVD